MHVLRDMYSKGAYRERQAGAHTGAVADSTRSNASDLPGDLRTSSNLRD
jgi:hypothetical protein